MKKVSLVDGNYILVDDEDYEFATRYKWRLNNKGYAVRTLTGNKHELFHRAILNAPAGKEVDHIHGNKQDNRKSELRLSSGSQNLHNTGLWRNNTSGYRGVSWYKPKQTWLAQIYYEGARICVGYFKDKEEAAYVREQFLIQIVGEFARPNILV